jgi:hypothetical protein
MRPRAAAQTFVGELFLVFRIEFCQLTDQPRSLLALTEEIDG